MRANETKNNIVIDEAEVIKMFRRDHERRLKELASKFVEAPLEKKGEGKVTDTVVSHGLKLKLKTDKATWKKGSLWVVTDANKHPKQRTIPCTPDQVLLTHTDESGNIEDLVILKSELDDTFELM